jgi:hypothetical protein
VFLLESPIRGNRRWDLRIPPALGVSAGLSYSEPPHLPPRVGGRAWRLEALPDAEADFAALFQAQVGVSPADLEREVFAEIDRN